ncbi:Transposon Ty3-I Gag-Pol polyprotein-like protein [Drosera capensis]
MKIEKVIKEFSYVMPKKLPLRRKVDHKVELEPNTRSPAKTPYRMAPTELEDLRKQLKELLDVGFIQSSKAPYGAPVLIQRKKDASLWLCIDYRALNNVTVKNKYYIPLIADLFNQLGRERYFSKLDLRSGYYQIKIVKEDKTKSTCATRIISATLEEHAQHLRIVFKTLTSNQLYVKKEGKMLVCSSRN